MEQQQQPEGPGQTSCEPFPPLPVEIVRLICAFACKTTSSSPFPHIDYGAIRTIALVSKALKQIAYGILYRNVTLNRPSDFLFYIRTVTENTVLAKQTQTLWIGATSKTLPPRSWWPLVYEPCIMIRSSITDPNQLPRDVPVARYWPLSHSRSGQWAEEAVVNVLQRACKIAGVPTNDPGVNLERQGFKTWGGEQLSRDEWIVRVFEVQEMLDNYLQDLRKRQDKARSTKKKRTARTQGGKCGNAAASAYAQSEEDKSISKLRRRQEFDSFEHPLVYARSGAGFLLWDPVSSSLPFANLPSDEDVAIANHRRTIDPVYCFATEERRQLPRTAAANAKRYGEPLVATLVIMGEVLMQISPNVTSLALTGCAEALIASESSTKWLSGIRLLSLGPAPPQWSPDIYFRSPALSKLEELHIFGRNLHRNEMMQLLTRFPPLENLKSVEWMWWPLLRTGPPDLWAVSAGIDAGLLRQDPVPSLWWLLHGPELAFKNGSDTSSAATFQVTVRAHHEDVAAFRSGAPPEMVNHPRLTMKAENAPQADGSQAEEIGSLVNSIAALGVGDDGDGNIRGGRPAAEELDPSSEAARVLAFELVEARWEESIRASPP